MGKKKSPELRTSVLDSRSLSAVLVQQQEESQLKAFNIAEINVIYLIKIIIYLSD